MGQFCCRFILMSSSLTPGSIKGNVSDDRPFGSTNKSSQDQVSNLDIYEAIMSTSNNLENRIVTLEAQLEEYKRINKEIQDQMILLVSAIANNPSLRANTRVDLNSTLNTSQVMKKIPSIFLLTLWKSENPNKFFPIGVKYLDKLIFWLVGDYSVEVRRSLGFIFDIVLRQPNKVNLSAVIKLLSDTSSKDNGSMRRNIAHVFKKLQTDYAFLVPKSLHTFLCSVGDIDNSGNVTIYTTGYDHNIRKKATISPGVVYEKMGKEWLSKNAKDDVKYGASISSTKYFRSLCTVLSNGRVPHLQELKTMKNIKLDTEFRINDDSNDGDLKQPIENLWDEQTEPSQTELKAKKDKFKSNSEQRRRGFEDAMSMLDS
jgi:hypothetical protein